MRKPKSTEDLAKQLEQEADSDDLWTQEPVQIESRPSRSSVLSLRLPTAEFHTLLQAARNAGESVSTYVRKAITMRLTAQHTPAVVNISGSYIGMPRKDEPQNWMTTYTSATEPKVNTVPAEISNS